MDSINLHTVAPALASEDQAALDRLENKLAVVRDRTASVALGYTTGFFVHGDGGTCKSHTVLQELARLKADYKLFNSRMTGRGLFDVLREYPDSVHVLEDMERIHRDTMAQGVLRSALWGQQRGDRQERLVTWNAHRCNLAFYFSGGIIMISNRPLDDLPELRALATRTNPVLLRASNRELAALMRHVAVKGYCHHGSRLEPEACLEVAEYIIRHCFSTNRNLDMRLLINSFADRLQWEAGETTCGWRDMVDCRLLEQIVPARETRDQRKERELEVARRIQNLPRAERLRLWREETGGSSEASLYRRLGELGG
jgi:hypothetical protein